MARPNAETVRKSLVRYAAALKKHNITRIGKPPQTLGELVDHKCSCGKIWPAAVTRILHRPYCPACGTAKAVVKMTKTMRRLRRTPVNKLSRAEFIEMLKKSGATRKLVGPFKGMDCQLLFKCVDCGTKQLSYPHNVLKFNCAFCVGTAKKTSTDHSAEVEHLGFKLVSEYTRARTKVGYECCACQFRFKAMPTNFLRKPFCPNCTGSSGTYKVYTHRVEGKCYQLRSLGELLVLKSLLERYKVENLKADKSCGTPNVHLGKNRIHRPDFYLTRTNTLIEVKSMNTAGLSLQVFNMRKPFTALKRKKIAAEKQGYKYKVAIVSPKKTAMLAMLPEGWEFMTRAKVRKLITWSPLSARAVVGMP